MSCVSKSETQEENVTEQAETSTVSEEPSKEPEQENTERNTSVPNDVDTRNQLINAFAEVTKVSASQAQDYLQDANWELQVAVRKYFDNNDMAAGETSSSDSIASHISEIRKKAADFSVIAQQKAKENIDRVGKGVYKGWGSLNRFLDTVFSMKEEGEETTQGEYDNYSSEDWEKLFQEYFPTLKEQTLVDAFPSALVQRYCCVDNHATEEQIYEFPGVLFITVSTVSFQNTKKVAGFDNFQLSLSVQDISRIQKGKELRVRLVTLQQNAYIFSRFRDVVEFDSALGILEHIWESSHTETTQVPAENT
eukprot:jgi/Galph1/1711/GphlegSOOS_G371.1